MDELLKLIDNRVKANHMRSAVKSLPCTVTEVASENAVTVEVRSTGAKYTVPNYSGSAVSVGESAMLYYTGDILTGLNAYIGASINKETASNVGFVTGAVYTGALFEDSRTVALCRFNTDSHTTIQIIFNFVLYGTSSSASNLQIILDGVEQSFKPLFVVSSGQYITTSIDLPASVLSGNHSVIIQGNGANTIYAGQINVVGHGVSVGGSYDPTSDDDYVYETENDLTNIIFYVGASLSPEIPPLLGGYPINIIRATAFTGSEIETVYIPDGITAIE